MEKHIETAIDWANARREQHLAELVELLSIPSISTDPAHQPDMQRATDWLLEHLRAIGLQSVEALPTAGHPLVYGEWLGAPGAPTVLIYGHYDVQPADPLQAWHTPPFSPTVRGDNLYARGASDDKGQAFVYLKAIQAWMQTSGRLPVNVKLMLEGEEEIGSAHLLDLIVAQKARLAADVAVISDTHMLSPEQPVILYGLRGLAFMEIEVRGPAHDLHSGTFGGGVHNPAVVLCQIIGALQDDQGRISIPGFYDAVLPLEQDERALLAQAPFAEGQFCQQAGVSNTWGEAGYTLLEQISARPTLDVNGLISGYTGEGVKTVLPAWARAKVSMRLVPKQDPDEIARLFTQYVESLAPDTVQIDVYALHGTEPVLIERDIPQMQAAVRALERGFGATPIFMREGGSIGVVSMLQKELGLAVILMGFGLPDDNLHAPNEKFHLPNLYRGIETSIAFLGELALTAQGTREE